MKPNKEAIERKIKEANDDLTNALHALKHHVDYDYDTHHEYRQAMELYKGKVERAEAQLVKLEEYYPEYFV